jgi:hypothetical protein
MKTVFVIIAIVLMNNVYSQENKEILYILPDNVETALNKHIEHIIKKKELDVYFTLNRMSKDKYKIDVTFYSPKKEKQLTYWIRVTNRYVVINKEKYPLLLDYDYNFSTKKPHCIGKYGEREGNIQRTIVIHEGYSVLFNKFGIIKE